MAEQRSPKPQVGGSIPSWPATTGLWLVCFNFFSAWRSFRGIGLLNSDTGSKNRAVVDWFKWLAVSLLIGVAVYANWYFQEQSLLVRVLGLLLVGGMVFVISITTTRGLSAWNLVKDARSEIRRVVWPTNNETTQTTLVVLVMVFIFAMILWGLDSLLSWFVSSVIG